MDARPAAAFRVALGLVGLFDLALRLQDFHAFYTDGGVMPRHAQAAWARLAFFDLAGSPSAVAILFALDALALAAFTVGLQTRTATVVAWLMMRALQARNPMICDLGDGVLRIALFLAVFVDCGAVMSLDTRLGRRPARARIAALPVRLIQFQIACVYASTVFFRTGPAWRDGTALGYALANLDFATPLGHWLARFSTPCKLLTWATLGLEAAFLPLVFSTRRLRALGLGLGAALHLGIALTMRVGVFSAIMPASYLVFLEPPARAPAPDDNTAPRSRLATAALLALLGLILASNVLGHVRGDWPRPMASWMYTIGLTQRWEMFSPEPPRFNTDWSAPGERSDGTSVDVLTSAAPRMQHDRGVWHSRWHSFAYAMVRAPSSVRLDLGRFLCRRYQGDGAPLQQFRLVLALQPITLPRAATTPPPQTLELLRQPCVL